MRTVMALGFVASLLLASSGRGEDKLREGVTAKQQRNCRLREHNRATDRDKDAQAKHAPLARRLGEPEPPVIALLNRYAPGLHQAHVGKQNQHREDEPWRQHPRLESVLMRQDRRPDRAQDLCLDERDEQRRTDEPEANPL